MTLFQAFCLCFEPFLLSVINADLLFSILDNAVAVITEEIIIILGGFSNDLANLHSDFFA